MGIFNSKEWNDMLEVTNSNSANSNNTPNKYCFISTDPRSPSEGFSRTPIQVEQTPTIKTDKLILPDLEKIKKESQYFNKENLNLKEDPRSPSINVFRTPIEKNSTTIKKSNLETEIQRPKKLFPGNENQQIILNNSLKEFNKNNFKNTEKTE